MFGCASLKKRTITAWSEEAQSRKDLKDLNDTKDDRDRAAVAS